MPKMNVDGREIEYEVKSGKSRKYIHIKMNEDVVDIFIPGGRKEWLYLVDKRDIGRVYDRHIEKKKLITDEGFYFCGKWMSSKETREIKEDILRTEANAYLGQSADYFSEIMQLKPRGFRVVDNKTWGSCSSKGSISFNFRIACLASEMRDYLVIHEIAHLKHFNHSKSFWLEVEKFCPDFREIRKRLRGYRF